MAAVDHGLLTKQTTAFHAHHAGLSQGDRDDCQAEREQLGRTNTAGPKNGKGDEGTNHDRGNGERADGDGHEEIRPDFRARFRFRRDEVKRALGHTERREIARNLR